MKKIGQIIKERREELGISQDDLAERCGYTSRTSISKIEAGLVDLPQSKIIAFADALYTTPLYIMGLEDSAPEPDETMLMAEELRRSPGRRMMFDATKNFSEEDIKKLNAIIKAFKGDDD